MPFWRVVSATGRLEDVRLFRGRVDAVLPQGQHSLAGLCHGERELASLSMFRGNR